MDRSEPSFSRLSMAVAGGRVGRFLHVRTSKTREVVRTSKPNHLGKLLPHHRANFTDNFEKVVAREPVMEI